jgi:hypothetical protein
LILAVIVFAVIGILRLLIPYVFASLGWPATGGGFAVVTGALNIALWAVVAILVIIFCFMLISCLMSFGGGVSLLPHR